MEEEKEIRCVKCGSKYVHNKKRQLCSKCYGQWYSAKRRGEDPNKDWERKSPKSVNNIRHLKEMEFIKNHFDHNCWIYEPCTFRLDVHTTYTPDFYDYKNNIFIEVAATRQAYHSNKEKYAAFRKLFPLIVLEIRTTSGKILESLENGKKWADQLEDARQRKIQ